jgi:hypothetical protein
MGSPLLISTPKPTRSTTVMSSTLRTSNGTVETALNNISEHSRDLEIPCVRKNFANGTDFTVFTNHFAVELPRTVIHQFEIIGMNSTEGKSPPREKRMKMMDELENEYAALR